MNAISSPFVGVGVYPVSLAARLADVPARKASDWVRGYRRRHARGEDGQPSRLPPKLPPRLPQTGSRLLLSFADLIEMRFVRHFRRAGVTWGAIDKALPLVRDLFRTTPSGDVVFKTDGVRLFADKLASDGDREALDLVSRNYVMADVLRQTFQEELSLDAGAIRSWMPRAETRSVRIDPRVQFGQPIVGRGIPTSVLADDFRLRGGDAEKVARWFGVTSAEVLDAVRFEQSLKADD